jgi:hypothetical protein
MPQTERCKRRDGKKAQWNYNWALDVVDLDGAGTPCCILRDSVECLAIYKFREDGPPPFFGHCDWRKRSPGPIDRGFILLLLLLVFSVLCGVVVVAGERPFSARCYSLISLSVPSIAARFAASRLRNGCFRRSSSRDPEAHPAPRQIANRSCPLVGVGGNRGLREKHPTQPHRSDLALAVHFGTGIANDPCERGRNLPIARSKCDFPFE